MSESSSRTFWDAAARENAAWYVATGFTSESEEFFEQGALETDHFLAHFGVVIAATDRVLEIGCGVGRMTRRLAQLGVGVVATDVSPEMLARCSTNLAALHNVRYVDVPGDGTLAAVPDASQDVVFSYIVLQHVPTAQAQLRYLTESARVLAEGGRMLIQVRRNSFSARSLDWLGHARHRFSGRRTLSGAWRGARVPVAAVEAALAQAGMKKVEVRPYGRRHSWIIARG